jgi:hypothetical protein
MEPKTGVYRNPWRGALLSATVGYLAFWPMLIFAQGLVEREPWGSIPAFFAHLSGALGMGLLIAVLGVVMLIGLGFWFGAVIVARALLQAAESWKAHAVKVFFIGGGLIGLALGAVALMLGAGAEIGNGELTLAVGLIDGLMAAAVLHATAGRRGAVDVSAVF